MMRACVQSRLVDDLNARKICAFVVGISNGHKRAVAER
jgi:hypothetical protein